MKGRIHSVQSFGTVDGPGVRAVVFMQGCPLRCVCCHNPDTWDKSGGSEIEADELLKKLLRFRNYFGKKGGITVSGGEPLLQSEFVYELFSKLKAENINTALDTSGYTLEENAKKLLSVTDLVLLDYKYTNDADYLKYTKCKKSAVDNFLSYLEENKIDTWIRQVIIPDLNDSSDSLKKIGELERNFSCIKKVELLPFRKLCLEKYRAMNIPFLLENTREPSTAEIEKLMELTKL
jgi:pyruvate formate lyase activating enzyme